MSIYFHEMIEKLRTGIWKRAKSPKWEDEQYLTLKNIDGRMKLVLHEIGGNTIYWTLNVNDSLNMKFEEME